MRMKLLLAGSAIALTAAFSATTGSTDAQALEWQMSPEGLEFMKRSVRSWAEAQIAAGEDRAAAEAAAQRCLAAYTGA